MLQNNNHMDKYELYLLFYERKDYQKGFPVQFIFFFKKKRHVCMETVEIYIYKYI
jgi:hypothetical protein